MLKTLVFKFFSVFSKPHTYYDNGEEYWTPEGDQYLAEKFKLRGYKQSKEHKAVYTEWSKAENIKNRLEKYEKEAEELLQKSLEIKRQIREAQGLPLEDPPLPEVLPMHMRGQAESTIRRMLAHEGWEFDRIEWKWREK